jgi:hypothetical protein
MRGSIGRVERMGDHQKRGAIVWLEKEMFIYNECNYGLYCSFGSYNSVPVVLHL